MRANFIILAILLAALATSPALACTCYNEAVMADVVFFGKVKSLKMNPSGDDEVIFQILTPYRGVESQEVTLWFTGLSEEPQITSCGPTGFTVGDLHYVSADEDVKGNLYFRCGGDHRVEDEHDLLLPGLVAELADILEMQARIAAVDKAATISVAKEYEQYAKVFSFKKARIFFEHKNYKEAKKAYELAFLASGGYDPWPDSSADRTVYDLLNNPDDKLPEISEEKDKSVCGKYVQEDNPILSSGCSVDTLNLAKIYLRLNYLKRAQLPLCHLKLYCGAKNPLYWSAKKLQVEADYRLKNETGFKE